MAAPTTLLEFAGDEKSLYRALEEEAADNLSSAHKTLRLAREELQQASNGLARAGEDVDELRERLADASTPGDGDDLLERLAGSMIEARDALRTVHRLRGEIREAEAGMKVAAPIREYAERKAEEATEAIEKARTEADLRTQWSQRLDQAPLSDVAADAAALHDGDALSDLADELEEAIPEKLRLSAVERRKLEALRRSHARTLSELARDLADAASDDSTAEEETAYRRARSTLAAYVREAAQTVARAGEFLGRSMPAIGAGEQAEIEALAGEAADTADLELALTEARIEVENKRFELRKAELAALADHEADASVVTEAEEALDNAVDDREAAAVELRDQGDQAKLDRWEVAVPDEIWRFFLRFHEVSEALDRLANLDPADLESDLADAEQALAEARFEAARERQSHQELTIHHRALSESTRAIEEAFDARVFSVVRGDG